MTPDDYGADLQKVWNSWILSLNIITSSDSFKNGCNTEMNLVTPS